MADELEDLQAEASTERLRPVMERMMQARDPASAMMPFVRYVAEVVSGLLDVSLLLLPEPSTTAAAKKAARRKGSQQPHLSVSSTSSVATSSSPADTAQQAAVSDHPEWSTVCLYGLSEERGAELRGQPLHSVSATAALHVTQSPRSLLSTPDYASKGPHFADWEAWHCQGAISMAAMPLTMSSSDATIFGSLSMASSQPAAFSDVSQVWMLSFLCSHTALQLPRHGTLSPPLATLRSLMPQLLTQEASRLASTQNGSVPGAPAPRGRKTGFVVWLYNTLRDTYDDTLPALSSDSHRPAGHDLWNAPSPPPVQPGDGLKDEGDWSETTHFVVSLCLALSYYQNNLADREKSALPYCFVCILAVIDLTYLLMRFCFSPLHLSPGGSPWALFTSMRLVLLPASNTWLAWRVSGDMVEDMAGSFWTSAFACGLLACLIIGVRERFLLHTPLQICALLLATLCVPQICGYLCSTDNVIRCFLLVGLVQFAMAELAPAVISFLIDNKPSGRHAHTHLGALQEHQGWLTHERAHA